MNTLIFSDTHLTTAFKKHKFKFLEGIILDADRVIIAGDFWEGKLVTFDEFVDSEWSKLFPLLKKKHTAYIFGNHDKRNYSDKRVLLFSDTQGEEYSFKDGDKTFLIKHGDSKKMKYSFIKKTMKATRMSERFFMKYCHEKLEHVLVKIFGPSILQLLFKKYNQILKEEASSNLPDNEFLICGHTHAAEIDLKSHYANTGIIRHGIGQYIIIEKGNIKAYTKQY